MLENVNAGQEMLAMAGGILQMVNDKTDFLVKDETLSVEEKRKLCKFLTSACKLHAKFSELLS